MKKIYSLYEYYNADVEHYVYNTDKTCFPETLSFSEFP